MGEWSFEEAKFDGGEVSFEHANFLSGAVSFGDAEFMRSDVSFRNARFSGAHLSFDGDGDGDGEFFGPAIFTGGNVTFEGALFLDGKIDLGKVDRANEAFPRFDSFTVKPPGLSLPT